MNYIYVLGRGKRKCKGFEIVKVTCLSWRNSKEDDVVEFGVRRMIWGEGGEGSLNRIDRIWLLFKKYYFFRCNERGWK